jgi:hypothetical protein
LRVKGRKERGVENSDDEEEASLAKADDKTKGKKKKGDKDKKKEIRNCNHCQKKGHKGTLKPIAGRNIQQICPNSFGRRRMQRLRKQQLQSRKSTFCQSWTWKLKTS